MKEKADLILRADHIFTAGSDTPFSGYVAVSGDHISEVREGDVPRQILQEGTCYIDLGITDDGWTQAVRVRKRHLELWDITKARLFDDALENTPHCLPPLFAPLDEVMTGINENYTGDFTEDGYPRSEGLPLSFILTNMRKRYGACTLFYPGLLEEVYSKIGAFYILPGSIHELFLIRDKEFIDPEGLAKVVMDVNQCEEMIPEYLSDHLYYYGGKDVPLQIVSDSCGFPD